LGQGWAAPLEDEHVHVGQQVHSHHAGGEACRQQGVAPGGARMLRQNLPLSLARPAGQCFPTIDPPDLPADNFSACWQRYAWFEAGTYRFTVFADDGVRLPVPPCGWADNRLLVD
jgi:hypothetical protein